jgi:hypothetical protein
MKPALLAFRAPTHWSAAIATRALIEKCDNSVILRRLVLLGAAQEGIDLTGLGNHRPPSTNGNGDAATGAALVPAIEAPHPSAEGPAAPPADPVFTTPEPA